MDIFPDVFPPAASCCWASALTRTPDSYRGAGLTTLPCLNFSTDVQNQALLIFWDSHFGAEIVTELGSSKIFEGWDKLSKLAG
jgi:hypothetical protein